MYLRIHNCPLNFIHRNKSMKALIKEIKKLGFVGLFFLICFCYILLVMKLFLEEYSINIYVISKALICAFFAAKSVLIIDGTPMFNWLRRFPRYVSVIYRSLLYTLAALVLGSLEGIINTYRKIKVLGPAIRIFIESRDFHHVLGVMLGVAVVFLIYNVLKEIETYFGKGTLRKIFLTTPKT